MTDDTRKHGESPDFDAPDFEAPEATADATEASEAGRAIDAVVRRMTAVDDATAASSEASTVARLRAQIANSARPTDSTASRRPGIVARPWRGESEGSLRAGAAAQPRPWLSWTWGAAAACVLTLAAGTVWLSTRPAPAPPREATTGATVARSAPPAAGGASTDATPKGAADAGGAAAGSAAARGATAATAASAAVANALPPALARGADAERPSAHGTTARASAAAGTAVARAVPSAPPRAPASPSAMAMASAEPLRGHAGVAVARRAAPNRIAADTLPGPPVAPIAVAAIEPEPIQSPGPLITTTVATEAIDVTPIAVDPLSLSAHEPEEP